MGTPLLTRVPSVRVKREMATLLTTGPDDRHLELELVKDVAAELGADEEQEADDEDRHARRRCRRSGP